MRAFWRGVVTVMLVLYGLHGAAMVQYDPLSGPLWLTADGRPNEQARVAMALLSMSADDGLDPHEYSVQPPGAAAIEQARFEVELTAAFLRFLEHLRWGRIEPRTVGVDLPDRRVDPDLPAKLRWAVRERCLADLVAAHRPDLFHYRQLRAALGRYRAPNRSEPLVRQIELTLERLRWLPQQAGRQIVVNIPTFELWAWDTSPSDPPALNMRVIVGRARRTQTPRFAGDIREVILRPYWNVPPSILLGEILPAMKRDPGYLGKHQMEVVNAAGSRVGESASASTLEGLRSGTLRVRQRPGAHNALGLIKFVFPNQYGVYMHGTPEQALFARARRDFSHGCVRVEDPLALAGWMLDVSTGWTVDALAAATKATTSTTIPVDGPVAVTMFYMTAVADGAGAVTFADDIYGLDARLDEALRRFPRAPR